MPPKSYGAHKASCLFLGSKRGLMQQLTLHLKRDISACPTLLDPRNLTEVEGP